MFMSVHLLHKPVERCIVDDSIPPVHINHCFHQLFTLVTRTPLKLPWITLPSAIKPRRDKWCIIVDDTIDLITPVKSKTLALIDAKYLMRLQRTRHQLFSSTVNINTNNCY